HHCFLPPLRLAPPPFLFPLFFPAPLIPAGLLAAFLALRGAGRRQSLSGSVVNKLGVNVVQRTVHVQPRTRRRSLHALTQPLVDPPPYFVFRNIRNHVVVPCFVEPSTPRSKSHSRAYSELSNLVI